MSRFVGSPFRYLIGAIFIFVTLLEARASSSVTLAWNPNLEPDVVGYRLYYGTASGHYSQYVEVHGATSATVINLAALQRYFFAVSAYNATAESPPSNEVSYTVPSSTPPLHALLNFSARARTDSGDRVMVGGFILSGTNSKAVLLRGLGPSLTDAGVAGALPDPALELYDSTGALVAQNNDWASNGQIPPPGLAPSRTSESAMIASLPPGSYTVALRGVAVTSGVALFELYDLDPAASRLSNISTRGQVGTDADVMIGGFIIGGAEPTRVIVRAIGPSLTAAGVGGALQDPVLALYNTDGSLVFQNDNWRDSQEVQIIATTIPPTDNREAAIVATLPPNSYTAIVRSASGSGGVALVEVYNLDTN